jgi:heme-degrading monooxygenase HmoA
MIAVIFEVFIEPHKVDQYLSIAASLRRLLEDREGFISIERFQNLNSKEHFLSLSFWESEVAVATWRNEMEHRSAQKKGRQDIFKNYRIRVASVERDYTMCNRKQVPEDSKQIHKVSAT